MRRNERHRFALEARARTVGAGLGGTQARQVLTHHRRVGLAVAALEVGQDALEAVLALAELAAGLGVAELDLLVAEYIDRRRI